MNYIGEEDDLQLAWEEVEYGMAVEGQTHGEFVDGEMGGMDMDVDFDDLIDFWVALSKAKTQNKSSGSFKTGFAVGCSAGAIAAMGAFYAFSSRSKTDDFMRA